MRVLMSGASGFIGCALSERLRSASHEVIPLVRKETTGAPDSVRWSPADASIDLAAMEGVDAVVHLSGANIAERRWSPKRKAVLRSSRIDSTRILVDAMLHLEQKPRVFICASAIGYYGDCGDRILTETSSYGTDFLALLTRDWEGEALRASFGGIRTALLRFGVILAADGGALPKMVAPIRWGVGGKLGGGRQWLSWIALNDAIQVAANVLVNENYSGPINVVSPNPVRNSGFTHAAAAILHRPAIIPAPAFALRLMLGEMAQPLLLSSARVQPARLETLGYEFRYAELEPALRAFLI